jgi:hypothetical protein
MEGFDKFDGSFNDWREEWHGSWMCSWTPVLFRRSWVGAVEQAFLLQVQFATFYAYTTRF